MCFFGAISEGYICIEPLHIILDCLRIEFPACRGHDARIIMISLAFSRLAD
jgi:hypothetical protein